MVCGIQEALHKLGMTSLRGKQNDAINAILNGRDVVYVFPTGTGKTLVYEIAAMCSPGATIIISPLLGLLNEQVQRVAACGVSAMEAYGESFSFYGSTEAVKLIYTTPEQAKDTSELAAHIRRTRMAIDRIVVDEAHLVFQWDDFRCAA
jgi:superfamily II DNA helicase RecQ